MSKTNFDDILDKVQSKLFKTNSNDNNVEEKQESKIESYKKENLFDNEVEQEVDVEETKTEDVKKSENTEEKPDIEKLEKQIKSYEKALNDTKKSYQAKNQENVLIKKKFKSTIEELSKTILDPDNTYLEADEFNEAVNKLKSIIDFKEEELEEKEDVSKTDNKSKTILEKLETELQNFKKYNKSKEIDVNYKAFYDSVHLLNVEERQNLLEYLEEAEPTDAIEKLLMLGQDYRNMFEKGLNKHKNIFAFVGSMQDEISKLNEEINKLKESVDISYDKEDNKQIKSRSSDTIEKGKKYDDHIIGLLNMKNRHN